MSKHKKSSPKQDQPDPSSMPAILFDLDGTLVDNAYEHVIAWREAFRAESILIPNAEVHRCVGMSGKLMLRTVLRGKKPQVSSSKIEQAGAYRVHTNPGDLLNRLSAVGVEPE